MHSQMQILHVWTRKVNLVCGQGNVKLQTGHSETDWKIIGKSELTPERKLPLGCWDKNNSRHCEWELGDISPKILRQHDNWKQWCLHKISLRQRFQFVQQWCTKGKPGYSVWDPPEEGKTRHSDLLFSPKRKAGRRKEGKHRLGNIKPGKALSVKNLSIN